MAGFGVPVTGMGAWGCPCHRSCLALKSPCCFLLGLNLATHKDIGSPAFLSRTVQLPGLQVAPLCLVQENAPPHHLGNSALQVYLLLYRQRCAFSFLIKRVTCACLEADMRVQQAQRSRKRFVYTRRCPTFATGPVTLFTLASTVFLHFIVVRTAGPDARAVICHHIVS